MNILTFEGVGFGYPGQALILSNLNFTLAQGERLLILGSNGSGKSTLALLMAGLFSPTHGRMIFGNREDGTSFQAGIVFQNSLHQIIGATVEEDLLFSLNNSSFSPDEIEQKITEWLVAFDLDKKRYHNVHQLSGGELRRLSLATVLITHPNLIILDEPLAMLDKRSKATFLSDLERVIPPEISIIWMDHDVRSSRYFERSLLLNQGQLSPLPIEELNNPAFLQKHQLTPAPLQPLEWTFPNQVRNSLWGPGRITFENHS